MRLPELGVGLERGAYGHSSDNRQYDCVAKVRITIEADQQMNRLPLVIRLRVVEVLARLAKWPMVSGAKPLQREWKGHFRIRVGDWRVVVRPHGEEIWIVRIDNRRDVYER